MNSFAFPYPNMMQPNTAVGPTLTPMNAMPQADAAMQQQQQQQPSMSPLQQIRQQMTSPYAPTGNMSPYAPTSNTSPYAPPLNTSPFAPYGNTSPYAQPANMVPTMNNFAPQSLGVFNGSLQGPSMFNPQQQQFQQQQPQNPQQQFQQQQLPSSTMY